MIKIIYSRLETYFQAFQCLLGHFDFHLIKFCCFIWAPESQPAGFQLIAKHLKAVVQYHGYLNSYLWLISSASPCFSFQCGYFPYLLSSSPQFPSFSLFSFSVPGLAAHLSALSEFYGPFWPASGTARCIFCLSGSKSKWLFYHRFLWRTWQRQSLLWNLVSDLWKLLSAEFKQSCQSLKLLSLLQGLWLRLWDRATLWCLFLALIPWRKRLRLFTGISFRSSNWTSRWYRRWNHE